MSLQKASAFMRGGGCCGSPLPVFWREIVRGAWREYLTALSVRQWAIIGAVLLCALGSAYLLWSDAEESVVIVRNVETAPSSTEIAGLSAAAKRTALRNPFSSAHERRGEIPPAAPMGETTEKASPPPLSVSTQIPSAAHIPPPAPSPPPLTLSGVVTAADGTRIAILAQGEEGAALTVGETWKGHTLRSVADRSATLDTASGMITLTRE